MSRSKELAGLPDALPNTGAHMHHHDALSRSARHLHRLPHYAQGISR